MIKFLSIMRDEIKHFLSDHGAMLIMILGITAYSFCYALPYQKEIIQEVPISVIDFDLTKSSKEIIRNIDATDKVQITHHFHSMEEAEKDFFEGNTRGFIVIPKDYEKNIFKGKQSDIALYADSSSLIVYKSIYLGVIETAINTGAKIEVGKMMKQGIPKRQAMAIKEPFKFVSVPLYNSIGGYKSYVYPMILILILHQTFSLGLGLMQGTRNEIKEPYCKEEKDIPITLFARSTTYILLYTFYASIIFLIFPALFHFPMHYENVLPLYLMFLLMMYAAAFFVQTISHFFKTRETALLLLAILSIIFMFISGLIWPRETMPQFINIISYFIPSSIGIDGIVKINQNGAGFFDVIYDYLWLMFLCVFYFLMAIYNTKRDDKKIKKII